MNSVYDFHGIFTRMFGLFQVVSLYLLFILMVKLDMVN